MKEIINTLIQLKEVFAEYEGEVLSITLNKKGMDAINTECKRLCSHCCVGICPTCGRITDNMVLGIKIEENPVTGE